MPPGTDPAPSAAVRTSCALARLAPGTTAGALARGCDRRRLHQERRLGPWRKRTYVSELQTLPSGAVIALDERAWLVLDDALLEWSADRYLSRRVPPHWPRDGPDTQITGRCAQRRLRHPCSTRQHGRRRLPSWTQNGPPLRAGAARLMVWWRCGRVELPGPKQVDARCPTGIFGDWDLALQVPADRSRSAPAEWSFALPTRHR